MIGKIYWKRMKKMFRPESLQKRTKQIKEKKIKNEKNRKRNRILNFRVSQEEYDLINKQVKISGLSKRTTLYNFLVNTR